MQLKKREGELRTELLCTFIIPDGIQERDLCCICSLEEDILENHMALILILFKGCKKDGFPPRLGVKVGSKPLIGLFNEAEYFFSFLDAHHSFYFVT